MQLIFSQIESLENDCKFGQKMNKDETLSTGLRYRRSMSAGTLRVDTVSPTGKQPAAQLSSPMARARPSGYLSLITESETPSTTVYSDRELSDAMV